MLRRSLRLGVILALGPQQVGLYRLRNCGFGWQSWLAFLGGFPQTPLLGPPYLVAAGAGLGWAIGVVGHGSALLLKAWHESSHSSEGYQRMSIGPLFSSVHTQNIQIPVSLDPCQPSCQADLKVGRSGTREPELVRLEWHQVPGQRGAKRPKPLDDKALQGLVPC